MPRTTYKIITFGKQVGIGVGDSRFVQLSAIAKENVAASPYCVPNEMICGELGRYLRLPVPPGCIVAEPNQAPFFASLDFNLLGNALPPVLIPNCVKALPFLSTGLLLFDIWIANCDRHTSNFSVDDLSCPTLMNIFDHSHALFGYSAGSGIIRLDALHDRLGISWTTNNAVDSGKNRHCLLDAISLCDHFSFWIKRIKTTPDFYIEEVCRDTEAYGASKGEVDRVIAFLQYRRDNLREIIAKHEQEFTAITNWKPLP